MSRTPKRAGRRSRGSAGSPSRLSRSLCRSLASGYHLYQFSQVLIYAIALLGLNLLTGYNGQISLGHGAFFAIGGYGTAILSSSSGCLIGRRFRSRARSASSPASCSDFRRSGWAGLYLALATFALAVAAPQILSYKGFDAWTGGSQGLQLTKPHAPFGLPLNVDQWTLSRLPCRGGGLVLRRRTISSMAGSGGR